MEDGSIFVCFVCEEEFREVASLQQHMTEHGTLPEMLNELPSRSRKKRKGASESEPVGGTVTSIQSSESKSFKAVKNSSSEKKPVLESLKSARVKRPISESLDAVIHNPIQKAKRKDSSKQSSDSSFKKKASSENNVKESKVDNIFKPVKIKPDPDGPTEFSIAMQRAMKIKKYIERKEKSSLKKPDKTDQKMVDEEVEEVDNIFEAEEPELGGANSSIMMVDMTFFDSGVSKPPIGPTIMNSEPDGFMVPEKISLGTQLSRKKNNNKHEKLHIQEMYLANNSEDQKGADINSDNYIHRMKSQSVGRGRGGKRGRPPKHKQYLTYDDTMEELETKIFKSQGGRKLEERIYQCLECYKEFRSVTAMRIHIKSHSQDKEIPCPYCDEVFPQRYILYEHLVNDHEESDNLTCPVCNKVFTRPDSLKSHMVRMHEENGGLNCVVCGKNFPSQGQLEMHVRVHTGERPFKCELCQKGFVQKVHLRTHLRTMHNMADANTTPCRICQEMFDGRASLREHYTAEHNLSTAQYKQQVAKLRKEGKIPDIVPPKVKVVDPSFRYQKVNVSEVDEMPLNGNQHTVVPQLSSYVNPVASKENGETEKRKHSTVYLTRKSGRKLKIKTKLASKEDSSTPGMGTVMNLASDDLMFTPMNFDLDGEEPKARDQEELNIVESAFKVAEEMDQFRDGSSTILMTDDSSSSGIYYSLPIDADDEYAQFAAEHAHIDGVEEEEFGSKADPASLEDTPATVIPKSSRRGAIVKAEPLEIYSDSMGSAPQAVEMLTM